MRPNRSQVHALTTVFTLILCACNIGVELRSVQCNKCNEITQCANGGSASGASQAFTKKGYRSETPI